MSLKYKFLAIGAITSFLAIVGMVEARNLEQEVTQFLESVAAA